MKRGPECELSLELPAGRLTDLLRDDRRSDEKGFEDVWSGGWSRSGALAGEAA